MPQFNAAVLTCDGIEYLDALWRYVNKGLEVDGRPFHFDAGAWAADLAGQNAIQLLDREGICCGFRPVIPHDHVK